MLNKNTHKRVWWVIDQLAARRKISVSAMARMANLHPTAFNPGKRIAPNGKLRFPNLSSMLCVFICHDVTFEEWTKLWNQWGKK